MEENPRHCRLHEVGQHGLVGVSSPGELNRAGEAVDLGPDHRWRRWRYTAVSAPAIVTCAGVAAGSSSAGAVRAARRAIAAGGVLAAEAAPARSSGTLGRRAVSTLGSSCDRRLAHRDHLGVVVCAA